MTLNEYQKEVLRTETRPLADNTEHLVAHTLGLAGEAGEFANIVKKAWAHGHDWDVAHMRDELGDVLWYVSALAFRLGMSLEEVAQTNVTKLQKRYPDGFSSERSINRSK